MSQSVAPAQRTATNPKWFAQGLRRDDLQTLRCGDDPVSGSPKDFGTFMRDETRNLAEILKLFKLAIN